MLASLRFNFNGSEDKYRFGFNGQHKENEVAGIGNHNSALFWEYDTRLGRRWNVDPVVKEWRSGYDAFNNNPIMNVDPKGDDDYFHSNGLFSHRTKNGTNIIIQTKDGNKLLSEVKINSQQGRQTVANVVGYYGTKVGGQYSGKENNNTKGRIGIRAYRDDKGNLNNSVLAFSSEKDIYINSSDYSSLPKRFNNYNSVKNVLRHEEGHKKNYNNDVPDNFINHAKVYMSEMDGGEFSSLSRSEQMETIVGAAQRILQASVGTSETPAENIKDVDDAMSDLKSKAAKNGFSVNFGHEGLPNPKNSIIDIKDNKTKKSATIKYDPKFTDSAH